MKTCLNILTAKRLTMSVAKAIRHSWSNSGWGFSPILPIGYQGQLPEANTDRMGVSR